MHLTPTGDREAPQGRDSWKGQEKHGGDTEGGRQAGKADARVRPSRVPSPEKTAAHQAEGGWGWESLPLVVWLPRSLRRRGCPGAEDAAAEAALLSTHADSSPCSPFSDAGRAGGGR